MNSQQRFAKMLVAMSDDAWKVVIVNRIDAMQETLDFIDAFELGRLDALDGKPCRPEQYAQLTNQIEYALGNASVESHGRAKQFLESLGVTDE